MLSAWDCDPCFLLLRLAWGWGGEAELNANLMRLPHLNLRLYLGRCMMSWCPGLSVSYTDRLSIHQTQMSVSQDPPTLLSLSLGATSIECYNFKMQHQLSVATLIPLNCPRFLSPKDSQLVDGRQSLALLDTSVPLTDWETYLRLIWELWIWEPLPDYETFSDGVKELSLCPQPSNKLWGWTVSMSLRLWTLSIS